MIWLSHLALLEVKTEVQRGRGTRPSRTANCGKRWEQEFLTPRLCVSLQFCDVTTAKLLLDVEAERHDFSDNRNHVWDILSNT